MTRSGFKKDFSEYRRDGRYDSLAVKAGLLALDGLLLGLAGFGMVWALPAWRRFWPLLIVVAYISVIYALVYSGGRYRVPVLPLASVMAAYGAVVLQRLATSGTRSWRSAGVVDRVGSASS